MYWLYHNSVPVITGVGQSLFSAHLDAVYAPNHKFIDPNIWFDENEMRKQVEQSAGCFMLTAQEAPETCKRMREDLYKKTMSADGIAGRRPYGMMTRMIELVGWKRFEVNKFLRFLGITENNFPSILRRSLVWKPMARFIGADIIESEYPDAAFDGYFVKDDTLKQFLRSPASIAAALLIQHGFEEITTRDQCVALIENYAAEPLTEDCVREACGLKRKVRSGEKKSVQFHIPLDASSQDSQEGGVPPLVKQLTNVALTIRDECLARMKCVLTKGMFAYVKLPAEHPCHMDRDTMWKALLEHSLLIPGVDHGKFKDGCLPRMEATGILREIVPVGVLKVETEHVEIHDLGAVQRYATGCEDREANSMLLIACMDKMLQSDAKKRGRKAAADKDTEWREQLTHARNKLSDYEDMLRKICRSPGASSSSAPGSVAASPAKRRKTTKKPMEPITSSFAYDRDFQNVIRSRAYVKGHGAQSCSRRLLRVMCPDTVDFDIQNSVFVILHQLVERLGADSIPAKLKALLRRCVAERADICEQSLQVSLKTGKHILHTCLFGGNPPIMLAQNEFLKEFRQLSLCLRWLACSHIQQVYDIVKTMPSKKNPEASTLHYLYAAVEDYILEAWTEAAARLNPKHLSLHFDGMRLMGMDTEMSVQELCAHFQREIKSRTGFDVTIVEKKHRLFAELCFADASSVPVADGLKALTEAGNCICMGLSKAFPALTDEILQYSQKDCGENRDAKRLRSRSYKTTFEALKIQAVPALGLQVESGGKYLLHFENDGRPHCVSCVAHNVDEVTIADKGREVRITLQELIRFAEDAVDAPSLVTFRLFQKDDNRKVTGAEATDAHAVLLDLRAGAVDDDWIAGLTQETACSPQDQLSEDECGDTEVHDDDAVIRVADTLLNLLEEEVRESLANSKYKRCPMCPFRSFQKASRVRSHIRAYHTRDRQFVCSGTKQLKVVSAIFDNDQLRGIPGKNYLQRSAGIMSASIGAAPMKGNDLDRWVRLVLTENGPLYRSLEDIGSDMQVRRVRNLYYTSGFADMVYREFILNHGKCKAAAGLQQA